METGDTFPNDFTSELAVVEQLDQRLLLLFTQRSSCSFLSRGFYALSSSREFHYLIFLYVSVASIHRTKSDAERLATTIYYKYQFSQSVVLSST